MTVETHGMQFVLDTQGVAKGFRDYQSAVEGVFKSLDKFEAKVTSTMKGIESAANNKAALSAFRKSLEGFSKIDIDTQAAKKLSALSAAMAGFKAPSGAQAANTRKFFTSLEKLPDLSAAFRTIKSLSNLKAAMEGFKAPPMTQARNLTAFANAVSQAAPAFRNLQGIRGVSGIANELATIGIAMRGLRVPTPAQITNIGNLGLALQHLGRANVGNAGQVLHALAGINGFRAPSASNIRNLVSFANALHQMKPPANVGQIASAMTAIAHAANAANSALGGFRGNLGAFNPAYGRFNAGARTATLNMMGLQNAFSGTFQAGSLLRSLLGSLTIGELGRNFFEATNAALQFRAQMGVLSKDTKFADAQLSYINETARKFGMDMLTAEAGFGKLSIAATKAGMDVFATREAFEGFSSAMAVLGTTTERQNDVWLAVQQVLNKGYLSAEELNQQLNEHLPGAMAYATEMANKMGMSLQDALKKKALSASDTLSYMAKRMKEDFGPSIALALERPSAQMNILRGNIDLLFQKIGDAGATSAFGRLLASFNDGLDPTKVQGFAEAIGHSLATAVDRASAAFQWLRDNWDSIKGPLSTTLSLMGKWMVLSAAINIGKYMVTPLLTLRTTLMNASAGFTRLTGSMTSTGGAMTRLTAGTRPLLSGIGALNLRAQAATIGFNTLRVSMNGLKMAGGGLVNMLGGPMGIALMGTTMLIGALANGMMNMSGAMMDANSVIQENARQLQAQATAANIAGGETASVGGFASGAAPKITAFAGQVGEAAQQLWNMAAAARAARLQELVGQINRTRTSMRELNRFDTRTFGQDKGDLHSVSNFFGNAIDRGSARIKNFLTSGDSQKDLEKTQAQLAKDNKALTAQLELERKNPLEKYAPQMPVLPKTNPIQSADHTKKKKGPDPDAVLKRTENAIDQLMQKLTDGDPIGELYADFVKNLNNEAQTLLSKGGIKEFYAQIKAGSGDAAAQTQTLINMLQKGEGLNSKTLDGLRERYKTDVPGIIDMLKAQLRNLQDAAVEAAAKQIEGTYKGIIKAKDAIGDFDPLTKLNTDTIGKIKKMALAFFPDEQSFADFYKPLVTGADDAAVGIQNLRGAIEEAQDPASKMHQRWVDLGITGERLTTIFNGMAQGLEYQKAQAEEALLVGGKLLRTKHEELMLMGLSADQAEIMKDLQQEVNDRLSNNLPITAQEIAQLKEKLTVQQALTKQMERQNEFFNGNGVRGYLNGINSVGAAINELDKNFLQSLEDQLYNLGKTGEFSFKAIFDTIQDGILRMASQGIVQNITKFIFGEGNLENGQPSFFGGTIGKMMGGYKAAPKGAYGESRVNPLWVQLAVDPFTGQLTTDQPKLGQIDIGEGKAAPLVPPGPPLGSTPVNAMYVRNADQVMGMPAGFGGMGGPGGTAPNAAGWGYDEEGYLTKSGGSSSSSSDAATVKNATEAAVAGPAQAAGTAVAGSFQSSMASVIPMIGMMFAGEFKSPIARIGVMFGSMLLQQLMGGAGGAGGGAGGLLGGLLNAGMSLLGGGAGGVPVPGALEGGITGSFVNRYRAHPAAFTNAPHYAEGTPNTSGGHPAILHDNEAVIPLSRGRKVPVELTNGQSNANNRAVQVNFNVTSPDADSFRQSRQQVMTDLHLAAGRAYNRNHG